MIDNEVMLNQEREGMKAVIDENRIALTIERKPMILNSFDVPVDDPHGTPTIHDITGRISHESAIPLKPLTVPAGESTNMSRFLLVEYDTIIYQNDSIVDYLGERWKVGIVDILQVFNDTIGYQAPIIKAKNIGVST
jgi:hypothetical protein